MTFEIESIDRMSCNVYQPRLQHPRAVAGFIRYHRLRRDHRVSMVDFVKGQRKDDVMHEHPAGFDGDEGVLPAPTNTPSTTSPHRPT